MRVRYGEDLQLQGLGQPGAVARSPGGHGSTLGYSCGLLSFVPCQRNPPLREQRTQVVEPRTESDGPADQPRGLLGLVSSENPSETGEGRCQHLAIPRPLGELDGFLVAGSGEREIAARTVDVAQVPQRMTDIERAQLPVNGNRPLVVCDCLVHLSEVKANRCAVGEAQAEKVREAGELGESRCSLELDERLLIAPFVVEMRAAVRPDPNDLEDVVRALGGIECQTVVAAPPPPLSHFC